MATTPLQRISVIVPRNPFIPNDDAESHCLCALDVTKIMAWWPGKPHAPERDLEKVKAIQRSLDWKRVAQIAAYLLQEDIKDVPVRLNKYFNQIYKPKQSDPGRQWPPKVPGLVRFAPSRYPSFSNILVHINGAKLRRQTGREEAHLVFSEHDRNLRFTVIDGQHRINGAYLALKIMQETKPKAKWEIPAEVFLDLDLPDKPPQIQAQIFIDVNFYQKKVDRSLVADLFPTTRTDRDPENVRERAQDIARRLMLETGPLVGMIQIPGIRYGVPGVVALATLVGAVEDVLPDLNRARLSSLNAQVEFLAQVLSSWLDATGRKEEVDGKSGQSLDQENVVYQGRVLISVIALVPACLSRLSEANIAFLSEGSETVLRAYFRNIIKRAGLMRQGKFIGRSRFRMRGFLGSGGIANFRNRLWGALLRDVSGLSDEKTAEWAEKARTRIYKKLGSEPS
jgi:DGQHR domain-containing protein